MSLHPHCIPPVPLITSQVAQAAFPNGNLYLTMRDEIGTLYSDWDFAALFPKDGQPAVCPWRLALICVMQFIEGLSDRQAAEAVRSRIDWKYALSLELTDPGFNFTVLCEFRNRLIRCEAEQKLLDLLLEQFREKGWLKERGKQRTDSTHVEAAIRTLNRLEGNGETLRAALNFGLLTLFMPTYLYDVRLIDPNKMAHLKSTLLRFSANKFHVLSAKHTWYSTGFDISNRASTYFFRDGYKNV